MAFSLPSNLSVPELFGRVTAGREREDEAAWDAIWQLRYLGSAEVLERAIALTKSESPRLRSRGAAILGQLGIPERTFPDECFAAIAPLVAAREDTEVSKDAIAALGHLRDPRGPDLVARHAGHADADIRFAVAVALGGHAEAIAIEALVALTRDSDDDIRDWATFGLGEIGRSDTPEVRDALLERLRDPHDDTRYEAICGLARCRDPRVLPLLVEALKRCDDASLARHAKAWLGIEEGRHAEKTALITGIEELQNGRRPASRL